MTSAPTASLIAQTMFFVAIPIVGWLAGRFGRRIFIILFGLGFIAATLQLDGLITNSFWGLPTAVICAC